jgi:tetratricopeptide (TPR) repeat protein
VRVDVARGTVKVTSSTGATLVEAGESWPTITAHAKPEPAQAIDESEITIDETVPHADQSPPAKSPPSQAAPLESASIESPPLPAKPTTLPTKAQEEELAQKSFRVASKFETTDPERAAQLYRAIATDSRTKYAETALLALAQVELDLKDPAAALAALDEHVRRFPNANTNEEALWVRVQALQALGKRDEARGAAADYLRQFPHGAYADRLTPK